MNVAYESSLTGQQEQWVKDAIVAFDFPLDRLPVDVTFRAVPEPPCPGHKDYMCTEQIDPTTFRVSIRTDADTTTNSGGESLPVAEIKPFYVESVCHELAHVVQFYLASDDTSKTELASYFSRFLGDAEGIATGVLADFNPLDREWEDRIQEAVAEVAKDIWLPSYQKVYDNRTRWALDRARLADFITKLTPPGGQVNFTDDFSVDHLADYAGYTPGWDPSVYFEVTGGKLRQQSGNGFGSIGNVFLPVTTSITEGTVELKLTLGGDNLVGMALDNYYTLGGWAVIVATGVLSGGAADEMALALDDGIGGTTTSGFATTSTEEMTLTVVIDKSAMTFTATLTDSSGVLLTQELPIDASVFFPSTPDWGPVTGYAPVIIASNYNLMGTYESTAQEFNEITVVGPEGGYQRPDETVQLADQDLGTLTTPLALPTVSYTACNPSGTYVGRFGYIPRATTTAAAGTLLSAAFPGADTVKVRVHVEFTDQDVGATAPILPVEIDRGAGYTGTGLSTANPTDSSTHPTTGFTYTLGPGSDACGRSVYHNPGGTSGTSHDDDVNGSYDLLDGGNEKISSLSSLRVGGMGGDAASFVPGVVMLTLHGYKHVFETLHYEPHIPPPPTLDGAWPYDDPAIEAGQDGVGVIRFP